MVWWAAVAVAGCAESRAPARDGAAPAADAAAPDRASADAAAPEATATADAATGPADAATAPADAAAPDAATESPARPLVPGGGTWETLAPMPSPRQEHGVALVGGMIFTVGGWPPTGALVEAYDPASNRWTAYLPLPAGGGDHLVAAAVGDKLYAMLLVGDVYETAPLAPPAERRWTKVSTMPVPRTAAAVAVIGTRIYIAGGAGPGSLSGTELQIYDTATNTWESSTRGEVPPMPVGRNHIAAAAVGGKFYAIGGRDVDVRLYNRVDIYDPVARRWSEGAPAPTSRGGAAAGVLRGLIIVTGGEGGVGRGGVFSETEAYDPATDRWTALAPMKVPRHGMGAVGIVDRLYVPGGATVQGVGAVAVTESFTPW